MDTVLFIACSDKYSCIEHRGDCSAVRLANLGVTQKCVRRTLRNVHARMAQTLLCDIVLPDSRDNECAIVAFQSPWIWYNTSPMERE